MTEQPPEAGSPESPGGEERRRIERTVAALRRWLDGIRRVPTILNVVLWSSVVSGLALAWLWFGRSDSAWVRWLALPWLGLAAVPQLGLFILVSSLRDLFELPERLLAIKSGLADGGSRMLERIRSEAEGDTPKPGFLGTLREAYQLHGEVSKVVATRALVHRFTGPVALLIGPAAFLANCLIVVLAALSLVLLAP
ncbi:MAG: hypothetical protein R3195_02725 [Gemmatimonadota bacterium]|nr:hypothetical protein [Gemmatimonadota bacterium]